MKSIPLTRAIQQVNHVKSTSTITLKGTLCVITDVGTRTVEALIHIYKLKIKQRKKNSCSYRV